MSRIGELRGDNAPAVCRVAHYVPAGEGPLSPRRSQAGQCRCPSSLAQRQHQLPSPPPILGQFLPRDAMHKRGLCRRAVSVCPSVHLSVRPSRSCILSKRINIFFSLSDSHTNCIKRCGNIPTGTP